MNDLFQKFINEFKGGKLSFLFLKKILRYMNKLNSRFMGNLIPMSAVIKGLSAKPLALTLAITNICNSRCIFCGYQYLTGLRGIMSREVFEKAIKDFVDIGGGNIGFTPPVGEPFLDPQIIERIKYCRKFTNIKNIGFYTNGILLSDINLEQFLLSGINNITISIGGFDRESYKKVFRVDCFDRVYEGIVRLCKINKTLSEPVKIEIALRTYEPIEKIENLAAYREMRKLVDNIDYQYNFDSWSGRIKQKDLLGFMRLKEVKAKHDPCSMFYADGPTVLWNGNVTVCGCRDLNGDSELILGNIMENSLIDLWRGEKLKKLRQNFWQGGIPDICKDCSHYYSVKNLKTFHFCKEAKNNLKFHGRK